MDRGYTGHEHLTFPLVGGTEGGQLINMNGRVYDPIVGRFLSPDNHIQAPGYSQSFNRYSYAFNNPFKYTDPSGEIVGTVSALIWDFAATVFIRGGIDPTNTDQNRQEAWRNFDPTAEWSKTNQAWRIDRGLFQTNPNKNWAGRSWEFISRFSWQLPQTIVGNAMGHGTNLIGRVNEVTYFDGITVVDTDFQLGGITMGNLTMGPPGFSGDFRDHLFVHEYGHYIQSQRWGLFYLPAIAIPSGQSATIDGLFNRNLHETRWFETNASRLAMEYFSNNYGPNPPWSSGGHDQPDFFDADSFVNGTPSPYNNPRWGIPNTSTAPITPIFHWTDPFLYAYLLFPYPLLFLGI